MTTLVLILLLLVLRYNIEFVKVNNKKYSRGLGIRHFPAISFFKAGTMMLYEGDVLDTIAVIDFLTSEDALELPDKIEEVDIIIITLNISKMIIKTLLSS